MTTSQSLRIGILDGDDIGREIVPAAVDISRAAAELHGVAIDWHPLPIGARAFETHGHTLPPETMAADRKSTRLNSSHSQISYAVFCLKKKKKKKKKKTTRQERKR